MKMSPAKQADLRETVKPKTYLGMQDPEDPTQPRSFSYFPSHKDGIQQNISEASMESILTPASKKSQWNDIFKPPAENESDDI